MGCIDILFLLVLFFSIIFALYRGLISELLSISGWFLAAFGALYAFVPAQSVMIKLIPDPFFAGLLGASLVALLILVIMTLLIAKITLHLRKSPLSGLDRILGCIFGFFRGVFLSAIVFLIGNSLIFSYDQVKAWEKENKLLIYIQRSAAFIERFVPQSIQNDMKMNEEKKLQEYEEYQKAVEDIAEKESKEKTSAEKGIAEKEVKGRKDKPKAEQAIPENKIKVQTQEVYSLKNRKELDDLIKNTVIVEDLSE